MIQLTVDTAGKMCEPAVFKRQLLFCFRDEDACAYSSRNEPVNTLTNIVLIPV